MPRVEPYNTVGTSPMWPFEYKLIKIKCKIQFSVAPATFQMLTSHVWLWLLYWTAQTENISTMAESSTGQHCSTAKAANKTCVQGPVDMYWHSWLSMKKTERKGRSLLWPCDSYQEGTLAWCLASFHQRNLDFCTKISWFLNISNQFENTKNTERLNVFSGVGNRVTHHAPCRSLACGPLIRTWLTV